MEEKSAMVTDMENVAAHRGGMADFYTHFCVRSKYDNIELRLHRTYSLERDPYREERDVFVGGIFQLSVTMVWQRLGLRRKTKYPKS